jgi:hypothetical protein
MLRVKKKPPTVKLGAFRLGFRATPGYLVAPYPKEVQATYLAIALGLLDRLGVKGHGPALDRVFTACRAV